MTTSLPLRSLEICAGAGGLALGLEAAGFKPEALVEMDIAALKILRANRPTWNLLQLDVENFDPSEYQQVYDVDLLSAGTPRLKSVADVNRDKDDLERRLVRVVLYLVGIVKPRAVLLDNVPGLVAKDNFLELRTEITDELKHHGFELSWQVLDAVDFGVPQHRKHGFLVAVKNDHSSHFSWPAPTFGRIATVGDVLLDSMKSRGWSHAESWAAHAQEPAPTLVGGSKRRGGADLGPTGAKSIWQRMGINGGTVADRPPGREDDWLLDGEAGDLPALTVQQAALLQGFPPSWEFPGGKTRAYKQLAQSVPPPLAEAVGRRIAEALGSSPTGA